MTDNRKTLENLFDTIKQNILTANTPTQQSNTTRFICENFIPICNNGLTLLSANGGVGKSFLAAQIACHLAKSKMKCLLWLSEDTQQTTKERLKDICSEIFQLDLDIKSNYEEILNILSYIHICNEMPPPITTNTLPYFTELFRDYKFIVIDPLIAFYDGDENSNSQARRFMDCLSHIARENDQAILITHHNTKGNNNETSKTRGASAFIDAVRIAYELNFKKNGNQQDLVSQERELKLIKDNLGIANLQVWKDRSQIIKIIPNNFTHSQVDLHTLNKKFIKVINTQEDSLEDIQRWENEKKRSKKVKLC